MIVESTARYQAMQWTGRNLHEMVQWFNSIKMINWSYDNCGLRVLHDYFHGPEWGVVTPGDWLVRASERAFRVMNTKKFTKLYREVGGQE